MAAIDRVIEAQGPKSKIESSTLLTVDPAHRGTDELVIALVGPIGSGVSTCAQLLSEQLRRDFFYVSGDIIKASDVIGRNSSKVGIAYDEQDPLVRVELLQNIGSALRGKFGPAVVADLAIAEISSRRPKVEPSANAGGIAPPQISRRHFTIIDSVKNPEEVNRLRSVYKDAFWLIGVFAPEDVRKKRLAGKFRKSEDLARAMRIDEDEGIKSGQRVSETMEISDYFVRNDTFSFERPGKAVGRFLDIVFGTILHTPSVDESSMYAAAAAASRSACLSRQVGAVIVNVQGEIIGTGTNDVPKPGGGLYGIGEDDSRCHNWGGVCYNDQKKDELASDSANGLKVAKLIVNGKAREATTSLRSSRIKGLIEFSRAVHAEMEAIISVARSGASGLIGSTLYSTTYPCHGCARHIVAAGVSRVVYIEPYPKSLALELHHDAISTDEMQKGKKVVFVQYEGVAPKNMLKLFYGRGNRKKDGKLALPARAVALPARMEALDDFAAREIMAVGSLSRLVDVRET